MEDNTNPVAPIATDEANKEAEKKQAEANVEGATTEQQDATPTQEETAA